VTAAALAAGYAAQGWPIFPIKPRDKQPLTLTGFKAASSDAAQVARWWTTWPDANIGCVPGQTGHIVIDVDGPEGEAAAQALGLLAEPTLTVVTARGRHLWFKHPGGTIGNAPLAAHLDVRADQGYVLLPPSVHPSGTVYRWQGKLEGVLTLPPAALAHLANGHRPTVAGPLPDRLLDGQRNVLLTSLAGSMRRRGASEGAIRAALVEENARCVPPLEADELDAIAASVARYHPAPSPQAHERNERSEQSPGLIPPSFVSFVPPDLDEAALFGLVGEFVRVVGPHSEADPAALAVQFLVALGNCAGRHAWFGVEADRHYLNLYALLVGLTSKGRKGTSWGQVRALYARVAPTWAPGCLRSGLSSGEGLIWEVRDLIDKQEPIREKGRIVDYQRNVVDEGVTDKRLTVLEPEFASTLRVMTREGNTLSPVMRQAWDDGHLRALAKNSPAKATDAHISIIGHITKDELRRELTQTDAANGFANRFLFVCSRRSKALPEGGHLAPDALDLVAAMLAKALEVATAAGEMRRDAAARALWAAVYPDLSAGRPGLLGAATGRAEAQCVRLACLYALLDGSVIVREPHLRAALALWDYCAKSAAFVFGESIGDAVADEVRAALQQAAPGWLSRTEISDVLHRNRSADEITRALGLLAEHGCVTRRTVETGGRPREEWASTKEAKEAPGVQP
jgi:hypothetical protein